LTLYFNPFSGTVRAFGRPFLEMMAGLLCPLLTSAPRSGRLTTSSVPKDTVQISRSKPDSLHRTPAGLTVLAFNGYELCDILPARPTSTASYPVSVRRVATLLHASFRQSLAVLPLRFASASPPSGCTGDLHPQNCRTCPTHRLALRAGSAGGLRPVLTAAVRGAGCGIAGRDGETGRGRTEKLGSRGRRGGELIAHPAVEHHHHLAHADHQRHFGWLAAGRQPAIKLPDRTVAADRAQRCHVQYVAHPPAPAGDGAVPA